MKSITSESDHKDTYIHIKISRQKFLSLIRLQIICDISFTVVQIDLISSWTLQASWEMWRELVGKQSKE